MKLCRLILAVALGATAAKATYVTYDIHFTPTFGLAPTSGSFTYDDTTNRFTSFAVVWRGMAFDFTRAINAPFVLGACRSSVSAASSFLFMTSGMCTANQDLPRDYLVTVLPLTNTVRLLFTGISGVHVLGFSDTVGGSAEGLSAHRGTFEAALATELDTAPVPEPSTAPLALTGMVLLGYFGFRRRKATT